MRDIKIINEEWQQRSKRLFKRSVSEADVTKSKRLWHIASKSEFNRLEWLGQIRNGAFLPGK